MSEPSIPSIPKKLGRYEIVRELGKGAMGVVYEGKDPNIGRRVAIKTARRDVMAASGMAEEMMERFLREARAAGALSHPNIITIYDAGEQDDIAYIAMEYLEGGDLRNVIEERRALEVEAIVEIGAAICDALAVAHAHGIVHRDIKPANIMMPHGGPLKVADFGIAHVSDSTLTQDGALIGTPHYMSPEQFMGQRIDGRSDLFSVGIILYEMLTGEKPFTGEALSTVMHHVIKTTPAPPHELNFAVSHPISMVVLKAISKRPADRYPDARAMAAALRESIKERPDEKILDVHVPEVKGEQATILQRPDADGADIRPSQEATMAGQGPPPGDGSVPGSAGAKTQDTRRQSGIAETEALPATPTRKSPALLIAGGGGLAAAVIIVVSIIALFLARGGDTPGPTPLTTPPDTSPCYSRLILNLHRATTDTAYEDYNDYRSLVRIKDSREDISTADLIEVLDEKEKVVARIAPYTSGDSISLEGRPTTISWRVTVGKQIEQAGVWQEADGVDQAIRRDMVFPPLE